VILKALVISRIFNTMLFEQIFFVMLIQEFGRIMRHCQDINFCLGQMQIEQKTDHLFFGNKILRGFNFLTAASAQNKGQAQYQQFFHVQNYNMKNFITTLITYRNNSNVIRKHLLPVFPVSKTIPTHTMVQVKTASLHIGAGAGKYLWQDIMNAKREIKIVSPYLHASLIKELINLNEKGIHVTLCTHLSGNTLEELVDFDYIAK